MPDTEARRMPGGSGADRAWFRVILTLRHHGVAVPAESVGPDVRRSASRRHRSRQPSLNAWWHGPRLLLGTIVSLRLLVALPADSAAPGRGEALVVVLAAAGAGAAAGLASSLVRPRLRRRGAVGAYLTGIVCVFAHMSALAIAIPNAGMFEERSGVVIFTLVSLFFGLVMGHTWFRDPDVM